MKYLHDANTLRNHRSGSGEYMNTLDARSTSKRFRVGLFKSHFQRGSAMAFGNSFFSPSLIGEDTPMRSKPGRFSAIRLSSTKSSFVMQIILEATLLSSGRTEWCERKIGTWLGGYVVSKTHYSTTSSISENFKSNQMGASTLQRYNQSCSWHNYLLIYK